MRFHLWFGGNFALAYKSREIEEHQFFAVVIAVLHHHAVLAGAFGCVNHLPEIGDGERHRHFGEGVFARFHRGDAHRRVLLPRGADDDGINIRPREQFVMFGGRAVIQRRAFLAELLNARSAALRPVFLKIRDGDDLGALDLCKLSHGTAAASACANEAEADGFELQRGKTAHVFSAAPT